MGIVISAGEGLLNPIMRRELMQTCTMYDHMYAYTYDSAHNNHNNIEIEIEIEAHA